MILQSTFSGEEAGSLHIRRKARQLEAGALIAGGETASIFFRHRGTSFEKPR